jgi:hypothetical protein
MVIHLSAEVLGAVATPSVGLQSEINAVTFATGSGGLLTIETLGTEAKSAGGVRKSQTIPNHESARRV